MSSPLNIIKRINLRWNLVLSHLNCFIQIKQVALFVLITLCKTSSILDNDTSGFYETLCTESKLKSVQNGSCLKKGHPKLEVLIFNQHIKTAKGASGAKIDY